MQRTLVSNGLHPRSDHAWYDLELYNVEPTPTSTIWKFGMCTMIEAIWLHTLHTKDFSTADPKGLAARDSTFLMVFLDRFLVETSVACRGAE